MKVVMFLLGIFCLNGSLAQSYSISQQKEKVLTGETQGLMPYLKYGPGINRQYLLDYPA